MIGNCSRPNRPRRVFLVAMFAGVFAFQCDAEFSFAVQPPSQTGIVYSFGNNFNGQTGTNTVSAQLLNAKSIITTNFGSRTNQPDRDWERPQFSAQRQRYCVVIWMEC